MACVVRIAVVIARRASARKSRRARVRLKLVWLASRSSPPRRAPLTWRPAGWRTAQHCTGCSVRRHPPCSPAAPESQMRTASAVRCRLRCGRGAPVLNPRAAPATATSNAPKVAATAAAAPSAAASTAALSRAPASPSAAAAAATAEAEAPPHRAPRRAAAAPPPARLPAQPARAQRKGRREAVRLRLRQIGRSFAAQTAGILRRRALAPGPVTRRAGWRHALPRRRAGASRAFLRKHRGARTRRPAPPHAPHAPTRRRRRQRLRRARGLPRRRAARLGSPPLQRRCFRRRLRATAAPTSPRSREERARATP